MSIVDNIRINQNFGDKYIFEKNLTKRYAGDILEWYDNGDILIWTGDREILWSEVSTLTWNLGAPKTGEGYE